MSGLLLPTVPYDQTSVRPSWEQLPPTLHAAMADGFGSPVASARVTGTGFTPGFAAVLTTEDGREHFVKAAIAGSDVAQWYAQEAVFTAALPAGVPSPRLRWSDEVAGYVVLCFDAVKGGRVASVPWPQPDLDAALSALAQAAAAIEENAASLVALGPTPWREVVESALTNWSGSDLGPAEHREELIALETRLIDLAGEPRGLFHCDLRLDNIILDADGRAWICDWNWLAYGPPWFDLVTLLLTAEASGYDTDALFTAHSLGAGVTDEELDGLLAALGGFYVHAGARPEIAASPHIRAHQRYYGELSLRWLSRRRGWSP